MRLFIGLWWIIQLLSNSELAVADLCSYNLVSCAQDAVELLVGRACVGSTSNCFCDESFKQYIVYFRKCFESRGAEYCDTGDVYNDAEYQGVERERAEDAMRDACYSIALAGGFRPKPASTSKPTNTSSPPPATTTSTETPAPTSPTSTTKSTVPPPPSPTSKPPTEAPAPPPSSTEEPTSPPQPPPSTTKSAEIPAPIPSTTETTATETDTETGSESTPTSTPTDESPSSSEDPSVSPTSPSDDTNGAKTNQPASTNDDKDTKVVKIAVGLGVSLGSVLLLTLAALGTILLRRRRKKAAPGVPGEDDTETASTPVEAAGSEFYSGEKEDMNEEEVARGELANCEIVEADDTEIKQAPDTEVKAPKEMG
ncbi:hypothetical protein BJ508DRAFT_87682 [Ascobolus immersus RN42]|uniref:Extracellular membrane protein CFEM domain-containing protein n=1 Tax=Ascobolus immersus RN42 TaxID=1160509 RepID=A0A3N4HPX8_ASCIM|nr:hypothetical protein BJ508DRAFT_87682 [Ascobolus immersus RN42]